MFSRLRSLLKALRGSGSLNQEIDEELRFHLEARTDDLVRRGMRRKDAERQARIELGGAAGHREEIRVSHGLRLFDHLRQDLRQAFRTLRRNPAFSLAIIGLIALGVGSNVTIFSVVDAVLFRPPPFAEPDRLVNIKIADSSTRWAISPLEYEALKTRNDLFAGTAVFVRDQVTVTGGSAPDRVNAIQVTGESFSVLGVHALLGRMIEETDEVQGTRTAVISHRLWHRQFDGDAEALGQTVSLSEKPYTIVGVMRPEIEFPEPNVDVWIPLDAVPNRVPNVVARMKDGVTLSDVQGAMDVFAARIGQEDPENSADLLIEAALWRPRVEPAYELTMMLIFAAFGCVLFIACGNVGGLLLGRTAQRQREIAVRVSLGAGPWRVAGAMLVESLVLAALGTLIGLAAAYQALQLLSNFLARLPIVLPHLQFVELNSRAVAASAFLCVTVACLCSLAPILFATGAPAREALRTGERTGSKNSRRIFSFLVGAQAAFACILLVGSGLMLHSVVRLQAADKGFTPDNVFTLSLPIGTIRSSRPIWREKPQQLVAYYDRLLEQIERISGPGSAAVVSNPPLSGFNMMWTFQPIGEEMKVFSGKTVSPQYFSVMGIPLVSGRLFTPADRRDSTPVAIITERLARDLYPDRDAIGANLTSVGRPGSIRIVGVVNDSWVSKYDQPSDGEIYFPYVQKSFPSWANTIVIRSDRNLLEQAEALRESVWEVDSNQPITRTESMAAIVSDAIWRPRFSAWALSLLGLVALLLTALGTYAVVNYISTLRMREVGIRMSVGATPRDVVLMVMTDAMRPLIIGLAVGGLAALALARLLASVLYETSGWQPEAYLGAVVVMLAASVVASLVPARRAAAADPISVLRAE